MVEISTEVWFRSHEVRGVKAVAWSVRWPERNPTFEAKTFPATVSNMLQYDEGHAGAWVEADRSVWQAFYLRWLPGRSFYDRMRVALAKSHNPEICLQASGLVMRRELAPVVVPVQPGFNIAFRRYLFEANGKPLHVFFSGTEDVEVAGVSGFLRMTHRERLQAALAGSRNFGQRNFEVAISGFDDPGRALRLFEEKLPGLVQVGVATK
ncbi:MAG: hypothetical protein HY298_03950 [Verrucomicrobia bacterium]|nr:hypothetical protein [Verrucomicrobiota bacterium]